MKLVYALVLALIFSACANRNKGTDTTGFASLAQTEATSSNDTDTDAGAAKALKAIYVDVYAWYAKAEDDLSLLAKMPDFDAKYMSADYTKVLRQVTVKDKDCENKGLVGFFDYDHWVCAQDFQGLSMEIVKLSGSTPGVRHADVDITNLGKKKRIGIDLVYEGGLWKIDDFHVDGTSEKKRMHEYLDED